MKRGYILSQNLTKLHLIAKNKSFHNSKKMMANDSYRKTTSHLAYLRCDRTSNPPQVLVLSNDESKAEEISIPYGAYSPVGKQS